MSSRVFDNLNDQGMILPCDTSLVSANSSSLDITGCRLFTVVYGDVEYNVPVYIVNNLNENAIAGIDMIKNLGICYDPRSSSFISEISLERTSLIARKGLVPFDGTLRYRYKWIKNFLQKYENLG